MSMLSKTIVIFIVSSCLACGQHSKTENPQGTNAEKVYSSANLVLPNDWRKVRLCGLTLSIPSSLKEKKLKPHDSCIGDFEDRDMRISLDVIKVGIEEKTFTRRNEYANNREFKVIETSIDGFKAEIINCFCLAAGDTMLKYVTVLDIPEAGLTIWIDALDGKKQKMADRIVTSVRFDR